MHERHTLGACGNNDLRYAFNGDLDSVLHRVVWKVRSWRIPPNWAAHDWFDEVKAIAAAAGCRAEIDYDPQRRVPLSAFVYRRALTCVWTRYRQEWAYSLRFLREDKIDGHDGGASDGSAPEVALRDNSVQCALTKLPKLDQWLIRQLFWNESSEEQLAITLQISQQAVSKRKGRIVRRLRRLLGDVGSRALVCKAVVWSMATECCDFLPAVL
jgi:DNA-directed RNA polymerase specialized sigma24 family protein